MRYLSLYLILSLLSPVAFAAEAQPPAIESLMTTEELRATGLDTLTPRQIEALNEWLQRYRAGTISAVAPTAPTPRPAAATPAPAAVTAPREADDNFGRPPPPEADITSRIVGEFSGWSGRTRFTLENGQVWEQRRGGRWKTTLSNPEVRINKNFFGAYDLEVISAGRSIGVRRIR